MIVEGSVVEVFDLLNFLVEVAARLGAEKNDGEAAFVLTASKSSKR